MKGSFRRIVAPVLVLAFSAGASAQSTLPARMSDKEFWQFIADVSEPGGYFQSNNFVSNEMGFQYPIAELTTTTKPGGVYLGVGPEQNFTYIVAMQPKMAVIFDIRRQNMIQHLMYKAVAEMSVDRAEFLSRLFSRRRPAGVDTATTPVRLFEEYVESPRDTGAYRANLAAIKTLLTVKHGFALTPEDLKTLDYVYAAFYEGGPLITYSFRPGQDDNNWVQLRGSDGMTVNGYFTSARGMPTYAELQSTTDGAGKYLGYLASEANYRWLRDIEMRNMLVPVVGNFAGEHAIHQVGEYLRSHGAVVSAFYLSNVEQYLFQQGDDWRNWFTNVGRLPLDSASTFIRSGRGGSSQGVLAQPVMLASMQAQVAAFVAGRLTSYRDVIGSSH